jgi:hypothetical protein
VVSLLEVNVKDFVQCDDKNSPLLAGWHFRKKMTGCAAAGGAFVKSWKSFNPENPGSDVLFWKILKF